MLINEHCDCDCDCDTAYHINNTDSVSNIQKVDQIKDLGILYDSHLTFKDHIQEKINKAYSVIGLIKRNLIHKKGDIEAIEKV